MRSADELGDTKAAEALGSLRRCAPGSLLPGAIARFKTAGLRDLSHSAPYLHSSLNEDYS